MGCLTDAGESGAGAGTIVKVDDAFGRISRSRPRVRGCQAEAFLVQYSTQFSVQLLSWRVWNHSDSETWNRGPGVVLIFSLPDHFSQDLERSTPGVRISHSHPCSGFPLDTVLSVRPNHSQSRTLQHIPTQTQEEQFTILTDFHKTGSHLMYQ